MGTLTAKGVEAKLKQAGVHSDGDGLLLKVRANKAGGAGSAQWVVRIQRDGKRRDIGLGSARLVTLAEPRRTAQ